MTVRNMHTRMLPAGDVGGRTAMTTVDIGGADEALAGLIRKATRSRTPPTARFSAKPVCTQEALATP